MIYIVAAYSLVHDIHERNKHTQRNHNSQHQRIPLLMPANPLNHAVDRGQLLRELPQLAADGREHAALANQRRVRRLGGPDSVPEPRQRGLHRRALLGQQRRVRAGPGRHAAYLGVGLGVIGEEPHARHGGARRVARFAVIKRELFGNAAETGEKLPLPLPCGA